MTQADIDNATTGRRAVTGALIAANSGGGGGTSVAVDGVVVGYVAGTRTLGVEVEQDNGTDVAGTTVLPLVTATNAGLIPPGRACPDPTTGTAGQVCTVNAAEDGYELTGGAAGSDRIVLADAVGVSNTAGPHEITLTEAMVARQIVTFHIVTSGATNPDAIGYFLSDDILALTAEATAPSDSENGLPFTVTNYTQTSITSQGGNYYVFRKDDSTLWVRPTRLLAHSLTITATPLAGGAGTAGQLASSGLRTTQIFDRDAAAATLTVYPLGTALSAGNDNHFTFVEVDKESVDRVELMVLVASQYYLPIFITREMLERTTPQAGHPGTIDNTEDCGCYYMSGRTLNSSDSREPPVMNPLWAFIDNRRLANRYGIVIWLDDNPAGTDWRGLHIYAISGQEMHIAAGYVYHF